MKNIIHFLVRFRNPHFTLDDAVSPRLLIEFMQQQLVALLRGFKILLKFKRSKFMLCGKRVRFIAAGKITFGKFLKLGDYVTISGLGKKGLVIGDNVGIGAHSRVIVSTSLTDIGQGIRIGNRVGIGEFAYLGGAGGLEIGDDCIIGQYFSCHPENHNYQNMDSPIRLQGVQRQGIRIGTDCWIGSKVTMLDGVRVGSGCVIAAGSVVTKSFPNNVVIGGIPAKILKHRK